MSDTRQNIISAPSWRLNEWFPGLDVNAQEKLKLYFNELQKFNKVINLVSQKSLLSSDSIHFADSVVASQIVREKANKNNMLYDLGSGNGFPGLVYAILFSDQRLTLIDSDERKCEFLKHIVETLGLTNVSVLNKKIEELSEASIAQAICRGFAPLPRALLMLRKIVGRGGVIYHLKSEEWAIEVSQIPTQLCSMWQPALVKQYALPVPGAKLFVVSTTRLE